MKKNVSEIFRFFYRFGIVKGALLYLKLKVAKSSSVKVPGIAHAIHMRKNTSDFDTFYQAIVHNQYKFNFGNNPQVIVDGGANIGLATIVFKNAYPHSTIISIEPDNDNFSMLLKNIHPYSNVHALKAGIWPKSGYLKVTDKYNIGKWGMITEEVDESTAETISTVTIDEVMKKFKVDTIDILKLDIETAEKELFARNYESWLPRVKVIIIELHDSIISGTAKPFFVAINKIFTSYKFFQLGENTIIINEDLVKT